MIWRDYKGNAIDCLIEKTTYLYPIEIKSGHTVGSDYFKTFNYWQKIVGEYKEKNLIIYSGDKDMSRGDTQIIIWKDSKNIIKNIFDLK